MSKLEEDGWTRRRKGWSIIWTHPGSERAIVDGRGCGLNPGIRFNGADYATLREAKTAALAPQAQP